MATPSSNHWNVSFPVEPDPSAWTGLAVTWVPGVAMEGDSATSKGAAPVSPSIVTRKTLSAKPPLFVAVTVTASADTGAAVGMDTLPTASIDAPAPLTLQETPLRPGSPATVKSEAASTVWKPASWSKISSNRFPAATGAA